MQYMILDYKWQKLATNEAHLIHGSYDVQQWLDIEHNENMEQFEKMVQDAIHEGWEPLGPPIFTEGWVKQDSGLPKRMFQPVILRKQDNGLKYGRPFVSFDAIQHVPHHEFVDAPSFPKGSIARISPRTLRIQRGKTLHGDKDPSNKPAAQKLHAKKWGANV